MLATSGILSYNDEVTVLKQVLFPSVYSIFVRYVLIYSHHACLKRKLLIDDKATTMIQRRSSSQITLDFGSW